MAGRAEQKSNVQPFTDNGDLSTWVEKSREGPPNKQTEKNPNLLYNAFLTDYLQFGFLFFHIVCKR